MPYEFTHQYDREPADFYVEPEFCSEGLFKKVQFTGLIHDPACGIGTILKIAKIFGYPTSGTDAVARGYGGVKDYLTDKNVYDNIVTNPPYNLGEAFIQHSFSHARHKIATLTRLAFLEGQKRYKSIYLAHPPSLVLVFSTRPSMPPYGQPVGGGKTAYCWIVWDIGQCGHSTQLDWIYK